METGGELLGKCRRIRRRLECFLSDQTCCLVIAVAVPIVPLEPRNQDERPVPPDYPHNLAQKVLPAPLVECFIQPFRKSVVDEVGEVLAVDAVIAIGNQQFLGANQPKSVEQLRTNRVVSGLAARQRQH